MEPGFRARTGAGCSRRIAGERLLRLVDGLPAELVAVLRAVAVGQDGFGPALLAELAGCPPERLAADLARLRALGLVTATGELTEPDAGQRVLGRMTEGDRDAFFTRAAKLGYDHGVANAAVAAILRRTRAIGEPWVVAVLRAAARLGQAGRDGEVTASLKRALQEPLEPALRAAVLIDLGAAELLLDQDAGDRHLAQVVSEVDGPGLGGLRWRPRTCSARGAACTRARSSPRSAARTSRRPSARPCSACTGWPTANPEDRSTVGGYGMPPLPERPADPARAAVAAVLLARRGLRPARVRGLARAALAQPVAEASSLTVRAAAVRALVLTGDLAEADTHGEEVLARARRECSRTLVARALVERAERHLASGTLDDAAADFADAHELVPPRHWHSMLRARVVAAEARVHLEAGRADLARQVLQRDPSSRDPASAVRSCCTPREPCCSARGDPTAHSPRCASAAAGFPRGAGKTPNSCRGGPLPPSAWWRAASGTPPGCCSPRSSPPRPRGAPAPRSAARTSPRRSPSAPRTPPVPGTWRGPSNCCAAAAVTCASRRRWWSWRRPATARPATTSRRRASWRRGTAGGASSPGCTSSPAGPWRTAATGFPKPSAGSRSWRPRARPTPGSRWSSR